jgi:carboxymethylenebutenolidase
MRAAQLKAPRWFWVLALMTAVMAIARAQAQSGIRIHMHGQDGYAADGLLYTPAVQPPFAAIVLVPDERGLTQRITDAGKRFAQAGFFTVAVDLNRGMAEQASKPDGSQIQQDLDAAFAFIAKQSDVKQGAIGVMGWGSGAISALRLASDPRVAAVATVGMPLSSDSPRPPSMPAAVLAIFAAHDAAASPPLVKAFEAHLKPLTKAVEIKVYPNAQRGFDDPEDSVHYSPDDSADSYRREVQFFSTRLSTGPR